MIKPIINRGIQIYQKWKISNSGVWFVDIPKTSRSSIRKKLGDLIEIIDKIYWKDVELFKYEIPKI